MSRVTKFGRAWCFIGRGLDHRHYRAVFDDEAFTISKIGKKWCLKTKLKKPKNEAKNG